MNLRTVRYYTQIGMIPPLELVGNKRVYTDNHIHYFRAIITLSRTGETLASIQESLKKLSLEDIEKVSQQMSLYEPSRMMPPNNESVSQIARDSGLSEATLYKWQKEARANGFVVPGGGLDSEKWSSRDKFSIVVETATLSEVEFS